MKKNYKTFLIFLSIGFSVNTIAQETTFEFTGEPETYVVPAGISSITITASGAQGGADGGLGATMEGTFSVTPGETLHIIVGEEGHLQVGGNDQNSAGGGGGSFVYNADMELLIAAGGGGGRCPYEYAVPLHAECGGQVLYAQVEEPDGKPLVAVEFMGELIILTGREETHTATVAAAVAAELVDLAVVVVLETSMEVAEVAEVIPVEQAEMTLITVVVEVPSMQEQIK